MNIIIIILIIVTEPTDDGAQLIHFVDYQLEDEALKTAAD